MSFEAQYAGTCGVCDDRIHVGDLITYALDDVLTHVDCEAHAQAERKTEICTKCWLTKPCDCEEIR